MQDFYRSDNTAAFGNNFITINLVGNPLDVTVSRADFIVGCLCKRFDNPEFPLIVNFTPEELQKLDIVNVGYLKVYDTEGRPKVCDGNVVFKIKNGVFCNA